MHSILQGTIIALAAFFLSPVAASAASGDAEPVYSVRELWEAFENNPDKAHKSFTGKRIAFEGVVLSSGPSVYATPMIVLSDRKDGDRYVACILPRPDFFKLRDYKAGNRYRFSGLCRGMTFDGTMVLFKEGMAMGH